MQAIQFIDNEGRYALVKELGRGTFGCVVLALDTAHNNAEVAIKRIKRSHLGGYTETEIVNHSLLRHPHVVQFRGVFVTEGHINVVMDYANAGSLFDYVRRQGRLIEADARALFQQLVVAMDYVHLKGVAHRDIKLENLLLQVVDRHPRPLVKICDLGYSKHDARSPAHSKVGTLTYMAPEVLQSDREDGTYDAKLADVWSMGVVLYAILVGRYPFKPTATGDQLTVLRDLLGRMLRREFMVPKDVLAKHLTPECLDLLCSMLEPSVRSRITMAGITRHPWFVKGLPAAALAMNATFLAHSMTCWQSEADIRAIVQQALQPLQTTGGFNA